MLTPDVNVLVYAHRVESPDHERYRDWLKAIAERHEVFGLADIVATGFVRVATNSRLWEPATSPADALEFVARLRRRRGCRLVSSDAGTWDVFSRLVEGSDARGKLVADAWLAALVIGNGGTLATCDGDFARFTDLRWTHPLRAG